MVYRGIESGNIEAVFKAATPESRARPYRTGLEGSALGGTYYEINSGCRVSGFIDQGLEIRKGAFIVLIFTGNARVGSGVRVDGGSIILQDTKWVNFHVVQVHNPQLHTIHDRSVQYGMQGRTVGGTFLRCLLIAQFPCSAQAFLLALPTHVWRPDSLRPQDILTSQH